MSQRSMIQSKIRRRAPYLIFPALVLAVIPVWAQGADKREPNEPSFSRDGQHIVYTNRVTKVGDILPSLSEIWMTNVDGSNAHRLTEGPKDTAPRANSNGTQIVFERGNDVWIVNADGSGLRNLTNTANAVEKLPDFSNDGKNVLFVRDADKEMSEEQLKVATEMLANNPWAALGFGEKINTVVLHDLATGNERTILASGYDVEQALPNPMDESAIFVVCRPLDNDGKPIPAIAPDPVVAVVKLNGDPIRQVYHLKPENKMRISQIRIGARGNLFKVSKSDRVGWQIGIPEAGMVDIIDKLSSLGDISQDGQTIVSTGVVDDRLNWGIVFYDVATKSQRSLGQPASAKTAPGE